jgi:antitoxin (DNA-binding transcriptional repressor) of toxin-antitoxin stability system
MKQASISDLKNQLSRYLDYVRQGETVMVLDRKVPVAELRPISSADPKSRLVLLERKGLVRQGSGRLPSSFFSRTLGGKKARALEALLEERTKGK